MNTNIVRSLAAGAVIVLGAASAQGAGREQIHIVGSSTVYPFSSTVAEHFGRAGRFKTPVVESTGTGGGFKLFCAGEDLSTPDINDASRAITDGEKAACAKAGVTPVEIRVGYDGIVLAASKGAKGFDLTRDQLYRAVAKTVAVDGALAPNPYKTWKDVDPALPDRAIRVYGPAPNHGTRDAFVELVMDPACEKVTAIAALPAEEQKPTCQTVREDGAWVDVSEDYAVILGKLQNDRDAVAVFTFSYLDQNPDRIQAAKIDGVAPSLETISDGRYPISRPLFIYVKKGHVGQVPGIAEFVQEFVSERAAGSDGYLIDKGLIPAPAKELAQQQAAAKALAAGH